MTEEQTQKFIKEILQGLWPKWRPTDMQYSLWIYVIKAFSYEPSEKAIRNWSVKQEKLYIEPNIAKVKRLLMAQKLIDEGRQNKGPVLLYEIIRESKYGKSHLVNLPNGVQVNISDEHPERFYTGDISQIPNKRQIGGMAERDRSKFNKLYGENHIIRYADLNE